MQCIRLRLCIHNVEATRSNKRKRTYIFNIIRLNSAKILRCGYIARQRERKEKARRKLFFFDVFSVHVPSMCMNVACKHIICAVFYLATAKNAKSTFKPVFALVSMNVTLYSRANRSPSSLFTWRSGQSALLPVHQ